MVHSSARVFQDLVHINFQQKISIFFYFFFTDPEPEAKKPKDANTKKSQWFEHDAEKSTKVYVSQLPDGPPDSKWNEEEFVKFMSKCGVIGK